MSRLRPGRRLPAGIWFLCALLVPQLVPGKIARLCAQNPPPPSVAPPQEACDLAGTLVAYDQGVLQVLSADQQPVLVAIDPRKSSVIVNGVAEAEFLRPGLFLRFSTALDDKGNALEPVAELTLFTPRDAASLGLTNEQPENPSGPFDVAGQLRSVKKGKLQVDAVEALVTLRLAEPERLSIRVKVSDVTWASPGDPVKIRGRWVAPDRAVADLVEVEIREPLCGPKKKRGKPPRKPAGTNSRP